VTSLLLLELRSLSDSRCPPPVPVHIARRFSKTRHAARVEAGPGGSAAAAAAAEAAGTQAPLARGSPAAGWGSFAASLGKLEQRALSTGSAEGSGAATGAGAKQEAPQPERNKVKQQTGRKP